MPCAQSVAKTEWVLVLQEGAALRPAEMLQPLFFKKCLNLPQLITRQPYFSDNVTMTINLRKTDGWGEGWMTSRLSPAHNQANEERGFRHAP